MSKFLPEWVLIGADHRDPWWTETNNNLHDQTLRRRTLHKPTQNRISFDSPPSNPGAIFFNAFARRPHLRSGSLPLDAVPTARKAELVMGHGRALHEVGVLESLLAQGALEGGRRRGGGRHPVGRGHLGGAQRAARRRLARRHRRRRHVPRTRRPPTARARWNNSTTKQLNKCTSEKLCFA